MSYNLRKRGSSDGLREYVTKRSKFFEVPDSDQEWKDKAKVAEDEKCVDKDDDVASEPESASNSREDDYSETDDDDEATESTDNDSDDEDSDSYNSYDEEDDDEEDEEDDEEDEEYYKYDKSALTSAIAERLSRQFARLDIPKEDIAKLVETSMDKAQSDIFDAYSTNKPADTRWKASLDEPTIKELEPKLQSLRSEMADEKPDMVKILKAHIPRAEKKRAIYLFDVLQNMEPYTEDYLDLEDRIRAIIRIEKQYTGIDIEGVEAEEQRLSSTFISSVYMLKIKIINLDAADETKTEILNLYNKMISMNPSESEYANLRNKIEMAVALPHRRMTKSELSPDSTPRDIDAYCVHVREMLDEHLYGMNEVKERLIEIVNNRLKNPSARSSVALCGGPGVGKTAIAQALAKSLNMPFDRIALGGLQDPSLLKGQDNVWVGSSPSIILQILRKMKYCNGILLFDEIDKLGDKGKEIQYALLHITDYIQNSEFQDMYLREFPHDLSKIWFMFAMNDETLLDPVLRDRLSIMKVAPYTSQEKMVIIEKYMLPAAVKNVGRTPEEITIDSSGVAAILSNSNSRKQNEGLRSIQKVLERLCSRINMLVTSPTNCLKLTYYTPITLPVVITSDIVRKLWPKELTEDDIPEHIRRMWM